MGSRDSPWHRGFSEGVRSVHKMYEEHRQDRQVRIYELEARIKELEAESEELVYAKARISSQAAKIDQLRKAADAAFVSWTRGGETLYGRMIELRDAAMPEEGK